MPTVRGQGRGGRTMSIFFTICKGGQQRHRRVNSDAEGRLTTGEETVLTTQTPANSIFFTPLCGNGFNLPGFLSQKTREFFHDRSAIVLRAESSKLKGNLDQKSAFNFQLRAKGRHWVAGTSHLRTSRRFFVREGWLPLFGCVLPDRPSVFERPAAWR